jgi:hypothetical protein
MNIQTIYLRVVPQDKDRGYMLMAGYDAQVVLSSCASYTTLSAITRRSLNEAMDRMKATYMANEVRDMTAPALQRKLQKLFGEPVTPATPKPKKVKEED